MISTPARLTCLLFFLVSCASRAVAPTAPTPSARVASSEKAPGTPRPAAPADRGTSAPMPIDPAIRRGTLDNGLRYFIRHHEQPAHRAALRLVVDAGSVLEED